RSSLLRSASAAGGMPRFSSSARMKLSIPVRAHEASMTRGGSAERTGWYAHQRRCASSASATGLTAARKPRTRNKVKRLMAGLPSHFPALAVVAFHPLVDLGNVGTSEFLHVPLELLAHARTAGQHAREHELGKRAGVIEVGTRRLTPFAGGDQVALA